ncbi:TlyA family rRNA (cytidine-2'-O)-methyltransferase [Clostridia bacterium]|nr:TlyA family rRNA (cytidine-2'-O)-methyltransferase [Clostridia bacterium]GHV32788.1 TlyA family rRNA (cytidine-2'-O)-methyltransferase [Clostridia bacterium]
MAKVRADALLVERGLAENGSRARAVIMAGMVYSGERRIDKAGEQLSPDTALTVRGELKYVSRGGLKLAKALDEFGIDVEGLNALDAGASTGGFTDCLLQRGAAHVWAVDVGYGQFAWKLREDERVTLYERTNVRLLSAEKLNIRPDLIVADLSFISLKTVLPVFARLCGEETIAVTLVKPQFEAGRGNVGKKGVVRDPAVHEAVLDKFGRDAAESGWSVKAMTFSPVRGPEGNIEYLAHLIRGTAEFNRGDLVRRAHESFSVG